MSYLETAKPKQKKKWNWDKIATIGTAILTLFTLIGTTYYSQRNLKILQNQIKDQDSSSNAEWWRIRERDSLEDLTRTRNELFNHERDSIERVEFINSFELSSTQFGYQVQRDHENFLYQQRINDRWLTLLDSQSLNTAEDLKFQRQLVQQNLYVNQPYVQLDSVIWDGRSRSMYIYLKNFGNRAADVSHIRFTIVPPSNIEVNGQSLSTNVVIYPNRSQQVARAKIENGEIIFSGFATYIIRYSYTDFLGTKETQNNERAYRFDFLPTDTSMKVYYARIRPYELEQALEEMNQKLQYGASPINPAGKN